jgi:hypothetical protein
MLRIVLVTNIHSVGRIQSFQVLKQVIYIVIAVL